MSRLPPVTITVYPYDCDSYGHLNEAAYLQVFERARWEAIAKTAGKDLFRRHGVWPAVRRATVDYHLPAFPGDVLEIEVQMEKLGRTSMELRQRAKRSSDGALVAEAHLVFVMIDGSGNPTPVPEEIGGLFGTRVSTRVGEVVRYDVGEVTLAADVRGDGPALLLIHGYPLDRSIWAHQVATLAGWRRIAPDLRGLGLSDAPAEGYSMAAYADDLARLLDRLRIDKAVIAGLSLGGYIAFEMLRRHRIRVAGLILADTRAEADDEDAKRARDEAAALAVSKGATAIAELMIPRLLGRSTQQTQPQVVDRLREIIGRASVPGIVGALRAMRDRPDSTALLPTIDVPTLVVVGQEDELTPPALAKAMTAAIPSAAMTIIPSAGHVTCLEAPTAVSRVFAEFLEAVR
ncbi:MAG: alpha/beta fold hydrolase [Gemmatimonadales bacterium]|nr:alpha/beta fold hydrolase [Gemmatimonadales bacterium]